MEEDDKFKRLIIFWCGVWMSSPAVVTPVLAVQSVCPAVADELLRDVPALSAASLPPACTASVSATHATHCINSFLLWMEHTCIQWTIAVTGEPDDQLFVYLYVHCHPSINSNNNAFYYIDYYTQQDLPNKLISIKFIQGWPTTATAQYSCW